MRCLVDIVDIVKSSMIQVTVWVGARKRQGTRHKGVVRNDIGIGLSALQRRRYRLLTTPLDLVLSSTDPQALPAGQKT